MISAQLFGIIRYREVLCLLRGRISIIKLNLKDRISDYRTRSKFVFDGNEQYVVEANERILIQAAWVFFVFLMIYSVVTGFLVTNRALQMCYIVFVALAGAFLIVLHSWSRVREPEINANLCFAFITLALAFTILISVFPYPDISSAFYPFGYIIVCVLFLLPILRMFALLTSLTAVYIILAIVFKNGYAVSFDIFAAVTSWLIGFFVVYAVSDLRLRYVESTIKLSLLSRTDALTGLPNRRDMEVGMSTALRRCQRNGNAVAAMMMDVDDFKHYNDTYGHSAGDECLKKLGAVLIDIANDWGIHVARYGGDEFCYLLPGYSAERATTVAQDLQSRVREIILPETDAPVYISLGIVTASSCENCSVEDLMALADKALYEAKGLGKNVTVAWHAGEGLDCHVDNCEIFTREASNGHKN